MIAGLNDGLGIIGQLQRVQYSLPVSKYDKIALEIQRDKGQPRTLIDPHDSKYVIGENGVVSGKAIRSRTKNGSWNRWNCLPCICHPGH